MFLRSALLLLSLLATTGNAGATPADCSQAPTFTEQTLCRDPVLTEMNTTLELVYQEALKVSRSRAALERGQQAWRAGQNACTSAECVYNGLSARITDLNGLIRGEREVAAGNSGYVTVGPAGNSLGTGWLYVIGLLASMGIAGMLLHRRETLTLYTNYTDVLVTNLFPVIALLVWIGLGVLGLPQVAPTAAGLILLLGAGLAVASAWSANDALWKVAVSALGKLALVTVFYVLVGVLLLMLLPSARRKGESRQEAEWRNARQLQTAQGMMGNVGTLYGWLNGWLCRYVEFSSLKDCLTCYAGQETDPEQTP